jgi:hypothetical protein
METNQRTTSVFNTESTYAARQRKTEHLVRRYLATGSLYSPSDFSTDEDSEPALPIRVYDGE